MKKPCSISSGQDDVSQPAEKVILAVEGHPQALKSAIDFKDLRHD
jgi:hypothetical protein